MTRIPTAGHVWTTSARVWCSTALVCAFLGAASAAQTPTDPTQVPGQHPAGPAGGSYQGPGDTVPGTLPGNGTGTTGTGLGGGPTPGAPTLPGVPTGSPNSPRPPAAPPISILDLGPDLATWESWWNLNRDRYLAIKRAIYAGDANLPPGGTGLARRRPDARTVADRVLPALSKIVETETDPALIGEALIALARADAGRESDDATSARVVERLAAALSQRQLAVVESAVLALGARGSARSLPLLAALVEDSAAGRTAIARPSVPTRVRAMAALSLGLAATRASVDVQRYATHALSRPLQGRADVPQDLAAACCAALGLVDLGGAPSSDQDLPASSSSHALVQFLQGLADDSGRDQIVRAQAVASVGRVAARADERTRAGAIVWAVRVATDASRPTPVRQAAAIALGRLGKPTESEFDRAARTTLAGMQRDTDRLARGLAWLARAEIGARARTEEDKPATLEIQTGLLADLAEAKSSAQGFVGVALGVLAHDSAIVAALEGNRALKEALPCARNPSDASALGLALGLRFDITSAQLVAERFARDGDAPARASLALGLGMAGATAYLPVLKSASGPENHPLVIRDASIARALLGDTTACTEMASLLASTKSLLAADFASDALAAMGDATVLDTLVGLVADTQAGASRRTRAVRALGAVADASLLPWNEPLRADGHFGAAFESWNATVYR